MASLRDLFACSCHLNAQSPHLSDSAVGSSILSAVTLKQLPRPLRSTRRMLHKNPSPFSIHARNIISRSWY
ncbi:hypothetical protein BD309DRAFT_974667 [Dichomitus squalens]|nr:hypothetical protein BD309DRAFT_974667 [Dichomitus squalens]